MIDFFLVLLIGIQIYSMIDSGAIYFCISTLFHMFYFEMRFQILLDTKDLFNTVRSLIPHPIASLGMLVTTTRVNERLFYLDFLSIKIHNIINKYCSTLLLVSVLKGDDN